MVNSVPAKLINGKAGNVSRNKFRDIYSIMFIILIFVSLFATLAICVDFGKPDYYKLLFILPLMFVIFLLLNVRNFKNIFSNFGLAILFALEFVRLVIAPFFLMLSGYVEVIKLNVAVNTPKAILLMAYETVAVALAINIPVRLKKVRVCNDRQYSKGIGRLHIAMLIYTVILVALCVIAPDILLSHRTIFGLFSDKSFTAMQFDKVIAAYTGSTAQRYCLILSRLFLTPFRLLFPAYLIIVIRHKRIKYGKLLCLIISFFPFLLVSDIIAQSIYFTLFLLLLTIYVYNMGYKKVVLLFALAALAVFGYFLTRFFLIRDSSGESFLENIGQRLFTYFSGVNIVSGAFNYPDKWDDRYLYLLYEFLRAIPMHNMLGIDNSIIPSDFFNGINKVVGQISTTIGMGYFYLGGVFAPVFSMILAYLTKYFGMKMNEEPLPLYRLTYMFAAFIMALGIIMYSMSIAFNAVLQMILPIYIIARIAFGHKKVSKSRMPKSSAAVKAR